MKDLLKNAYFAGLIDGEGNVNIYPGNYSKTPRPVIKVDMTCHATILALHKHFGGYIGVKKTKRHDKPQYRWEVTYRKAIIVANIIRPFVITKKDAVIMILSHKANPRGAPKGSRNAKKHPPLSM